MHINILPKDLRINNLFHKHLTILTGKDWCFTHFSTGMAGWLLLIFLICLHNQLIDSRYGRFYDIISFSSNWKTPWRHILESTEQKLLGVAVDRNLNFDEHVFDLCEKASWKLSVLARLSNYMSFDKRKTFPKAFDES